MQGAEPSVSVCGRGGWGEGQSAETGRPSSGAAVGSRPSSPRRASSAMAADTNETKTASGNRFDTGTPPCVAAKQMRRVGTHRTGVLASPPSPYGNVELLGEGRGHCCTRTDWRKTGETVVEGNSGGDHAVDGPQHGGLARSRPEQPVKLSPQHLGH